MAPSRHSSLFEALAPSVIVWGKGDLANEIMGLIAQSKVLVMPVHSSEGLVGCIGRRPSVVIVFSPTEPPYGMPSWKSANRPAAADASGPNAPRAYPRNLLSFGPEAAFAARTVRNLGPNGPAIVIVDALFSTGPERTFEVMTDGWTRFAAINVVHLRSTLGAALGALLDVNVAGASLALALGVDKTPPDSYAALEAYFAGRRRSIEAALTWSSATIELRGNALEVQMSHTDDETHDLKITLGDGRVANNDAVPAIVMRATLPRVTCEASKLLPQRGVMGLLRRIGQVILDIEELDRRFVIKGDKKSAQEWGTVVELLCALDTIAAFGASLDARSLTLDVTSLDEEKTGAFVSTAVQVWQTLVRRRLGIP